MAGESAEGTSKARVFIWKSLFNLKTEYQFLYEWMNANWIDISEFEIKFSRTIAVA